MSSANNAKQFYYYNINKRPKSLLPYPSCLIFRKYIFTLSVL